MKESFVVWVEGKVKVSNQHFSNVCNGKKAKMFMNISFFDALNF